MQKATTFPALVFSLVLFGCSSVSHEGDSQTLRVWHWMGDRQAAFEELGRRYQAKTGIPVQFELYAPSEAYSQKIKAAAQTKTLPDIFGVLGDTKDFASFINSGFVASVDSYLGDRLVPWKEGLFKKAVEVNQFLPQNEYDVPPGVYGVPLDMTNVQFLYNKALFRQAGLDPEQPPKTWDEFLQVSRVLRDKDIPGLVSGFGEIWLLDIMATSFAMNLMGPEKVYETYRGNVSYTDPDWIKVLSLFQTMADEGIYASGTVTMVNKTSEQTFANQRAALTWNGSWCVNVYQGMNPNLEYGVMLPPRLSNMHPVMIWGGAGNSLMVNEMSSRKEKALDFLIWMTERDQQVYFASETNNLPAARAAVDNLPRVLAQFSDDLDHTFHLNTMPVHEYSRVMEAWGKGIQSIMIGEKSPELVAKEVQELKEREARRKGRS